MIKIIKILPHEVKLVVIKVKMLRVLLFVSLPEIFVLIAGRRAVVTTLVQKWRVAVVPDLFAVGSDLHELFQEALNIIILHLILIFPLITWLLT